MDRTVSSGDEIRSADEMEDRIIMDSQRVEYAQTQRGHHRSRRSRTLRQGTSYLHADLSAVRID